MGSRVAVKQHAARFLGFVIPCLMLTNCGVTKFCGKDETVDTFTGECRKNKPSQSQTPQAQYAYCICQLDSGPTVAYFDSKPTNYGDKGPITVYTNGCRDTRLCMDPDTVYDSGTVTLDNIFNWQYDGRFGTYGAYGSRQQSDNGRNFSPAERFKWVYLRLATSYTEVSRVAFGKPKDNSVATCRQECDAGNPWCLRLSMAGNEQSGLKNLLQVGASSPPLVKKADILRMFGQASDDCERGDTAISGGVVENRGRACNMISSTSVSDVVVHLPPVLRGKWSVQGANVQAIFDDDATRGNLHFTDKTLDEQYGGPINAVYGEGDKVMGFSVGAASCISLDLN
ncbi:hypothetical protein KUL72_04385 [Bradyrhizobium arachidis]|uniref:hypothetical protein n=1 Tax=Bradyrhizobium arachidis TaxID=858423 RepID=UPI0021627155|nr:hypothetical protein [Bradyrhizobium arachidis]UVO37635.1 hypothetical protein KUL72_04385 [Bradyrhizobium arachidis]